METIFDQEVTEKELEFVTGFPNTTEESYLNYRNPRGIYEDLYLLYLFRKDKKKANEYYDKAQEIEFVFGVDNIFERLLEDESMKSYLAVKV